MSCTHAIARNKTWFTDKPSRNATHVNLSWRFLLTGFPWYLEISYKVTVKPGKWLDFYFSALRINKSERQIFHLLHGNSSPSYWSRTVWCRCRCVATLHTTLYAHSTQKIPIPYLRGEIKQIAYVLTHRCTFCWKILSIASHISRIRHYAMLHTCSCPFGCRTSTNSARVYTILGSQYHALYIQLQSQLWKRITNKEVRLIPLWPFCNMWSTTSCLIKLWPNPDWSLRYPLFC